MKEQQNYYDIFEGEDEYTLIFGPPETIDQDVDWVDQVLDEDDGTTSPFLDFAEQTEIEGLNGDDTIYGSEDGYNFIYGHGGDDVIFGGDGHYNRLYGGDGDDTFYVGTGQRNVARGGTATIPSTSVTGHIFGDDGNDTFHQEGGTAFGGDGDDVFFSQDGSIIAGDGNDVIYGGNANGHSIGAHGPQGNWYRGDDGDDVILSGEADYQRLDGGAGDDTLLSFGYGTILDGGTGNDTLSLDGAGEVIVYRPGDGTDTVHGFHNSTGAVIDVSAFGFTSAASLPSYASVHGDDVHVNFGGTNELILVDFHAAGWTLDSTHFII